MRDQWLYFNLGGGGGGGGGGRGGGGGSRGRRGQRRRPTSYKMQNPLFPLYLGVSISPLQNFIFGLNWKKKLSQQST